MNVFQLIEMETTTLSKMIRLMLSLSVFNVGLTFCREVSDIPNPLLRPTDCGRSRFNQSYVCNPDNILSNEEANELDGSILNMYHTTQCPCSAEACKPNSYGYLAGIAIVKNMQPGASVQLASATAGDGEAALMMDSTLSLTRTFAKTLLASWQLGRCKESVLIFYSQSENMYFTAADSLASAKLTSDIVGEIAANARMLFAKNTTVGLLKLIEDYRAVFLGSYKRTTNWQSSGSEPRFEGVASAADSTVVNSSRQYIVLSLFAIISSLSVCLLVNTQSVTHVY